jgi:hypothetical protein
MSSATSSPASPRGSPPPPRPLRGTGAVSPAPAWPLRAWRRLPVVVRAILAGELVVSVAGLVPALLVLGNLKLSPRVPWLLPATAAWLWLCWRYLDGWGWPRRTAAARRRDLRARSLPARVWGWALAAGTLGIASVAGLAFLTPRLAAIPRDAFKLPIDLNAYPPWTTAAILLAISARTEDDWKALDQMAQSAGNTLNRAALGKKRVVRVVRGMTAQDSHVYLAIETPQGWALDRWDEDARPPPRCFSTLSTRIPPRSRAFQNG